VSLNLQPVLWENPPSKNMVVYSGKDDITQSILCKISKVTLCLDPSRVESKRDFFIFSLKAKNNQKCTNFSKILFRFYERCCFTKVIATNFANFEEVLSKAVVATKFCNLFRKYKN
jgi:hypothetical protein